MFNLERQERTLIAILTAALMIGAAVLYCKASFRRAPLRVVRHDLAREVSAININEAGCEDLMRLTGVGRKLANTIIEYRESHGMFSTKDDIKNVKGVGDKMFEKIKDDITIE